MLKVLNGAAALLTSYFSRLYYSGFSSSDGYLLITSKKKYLFVDFRYYEAAKKQKSDIIVVLITGRPYKEINEIFKSNNIVKIGIEYNRVNILQFNEFKLIFNGAEFFDISEQISNEKMVKKSFEIENIKKAQEITDKAFSHILPFIKPGVCELEIVAELEYFMKKQGSYDTAFNTIALSGAKTAMCHGVSDNNIIKNNSFFLLDFGAKYNNYCSDMTRTVAVGEPSEKMKKIYELVLSANEAAEKSIRAGVIGSDIDAIARNIITENGFENNFGHALGHGLGQECHEMPSFSTKYNKTIPENSVLSVEPGIYLENEFGVRIEDLVVVIATGVEIITKSEKSLIIL